MDTNNKAIDAIETAIYQRHQGLLHKFSKMCYARLIAAGVLIEFEDVFQQTTEAFIKAHRKFDPNAGYSFPAYFGQACWNNLNKWASKLIREQCGDEKGAGLGYVRLDDMAHTKKNDHSEDCDTIAILFEGADENTPENNMLHRESVERAMKRLSPDAKSIVTELISPSADMNQFHTKEVATKAALRAEGDSFRATKDHTFHAIGRYLKMSPARVTAARRELMEAFGVEG